MLTFEFIFEKKKISGANFEKSWKTYIFLTSGKFVKKVEFVDLVK